MSIYRLCVPRLFSIFFLVSNSNSARKGKKINDDNKENRKKRSTRGNIVTLLFYILLVDNNKKNKNKCKLYLWKFTECLFNCVCVCVCEFDVLKLNENIHNKPLSYLSIVFSWFFEIVIFTK